MYSPDNGARLSARRTWQRATYTERTEMLADAGFKDNPALHNWQNFDELPTELIVDLNNAHTKKLSQPHNQRVIDVLKRAHAKGCRLVIDNDGEVIATPEVMPGQRVIANIHKQHALFEEVA